MQYDERPADVEERWVPFEPPEIDRFYTYADDAGTPRSKMYHNENLPLALMNHVTEYRYPQYGSQGRDGSLQRLISGQQPRPASFRTGLQPPPDTRGAPDLSMEGLVRHGLAPDGRGVAAQEGDDDFFRQLAARLSLAQQMSAAPEAAVPAPSATPKSVPKKKSNKSEFFALLRRIDAEEKDGKKDTRKALKQLAKQLSDSDSVATKGNATGKIEV